MTQQFEPDSGLSTADTGVGSWQPPPVDLPDDRQGVAGKSANPLRLHMKETKEAHEIAFRLRGQMLPLVELQCARLMRLPLLSHVEGRTVVYFVPGDKESPYDNGYPTPDTAQHRGYAKRANHFQAAKVRIICISSQSSGSLRKVGEWFRFSHFMLSDPDLLVGKALNLPTFVSDGAIRYRRLTLVAYDGKVERVFYPISDASAPNNARQIMTWLQIGAQNDFGNVI